MFAGRRVHRSLGRCVQMPQQQRGSGTLSGIDTGQELGLDSAVLPGDAERVLLQGLPRGGREGRGRSGPVADVDDLFRTGEDEQLRIERVENGGDTAPEGSSASAKISRASPSPCATRADAAGRSAGASWPALMKRSRMAENPTAVSRQP